MRSRYAQVYMWVLRELNDIGITLDGRTLTARARDDLKQYLDPSVDEVVSLFAGLVAFGVQFVAEDADAAARFAAHPVFGRLGKMGVQT